MSTAVKNLDGSIVIVLFNPTEKSENITLNIINQKQYLTIDKQAIQTLVIQSNN
jgi:glucosylceramidase